MRARRDAGARQAVVLPLVGTRRVDHQERAQGREILPLQLDRVEARRGELRRPVRREFGRERARTLKRAPSDDELKIAHAREALGDASAEGPVTSNEENPLHSPLPSGGASPRRVREKRSAGPRFLQVPQEESLPHARPHAYLPGLEALRKIALAPAALIATGGRARPLGAA